MCKKLFAWDRIVKGEARRHYCPRVDTSAPSGRLWAWAGLAALALLLLAATAGGSLAIALNAPQPSGSVPGGVLGFGLAGALLRHTARRASA